MPLDPSSTRSHPTSGSSSPEPREPHASSPSVEGEDGKRGKLAPLDHLLRKLEGADEQIQVLAFHPRDDKLWVTRKASRYHLTVRRGGYHFTFSSKGLTQFLRLFDVSNRLLDRLARAGRTEDTRLLNVLLWSAGADPSYRVQIKVLGSRVIAAYSGGYVFLSNQQVASALERPEDDGLLRVRRYFWNGPDLALVLEHPDIGALDPAASQGGRNSDEWKPGAILFHSEQGGTSLTVFPALIRERGGLILPVVASQGEVQRLSHRDKTASDLTRELLAAVQATRAAPFTQVNGHLAFLRRLPLPTTSLHTYLSGLRLSFLTTERIGSVITRLESRRATFYGLLLALLRELGQMPYGTERLGAELEVARFVWTKASEERGD